MGEKKLFSKKELYVFFILSLKVKKIYECVMYISLDKLGSTY